MIHPRERRRAVLRAGASPAAATAATLALAVAVPAPALAAAVSVGYGSCASNNTALAPAPPDYTAQVTLTPSATTVTVGTRVTITWHQAESTTPQAIPVADAASEKAAIVVGGAASQRLTAGPSPKFPSAPVAVGGTFQIPDFSATFTPSTPGTYTFTPGDNEEDAIADVVITCKAKTTAVAATITVTAAAGGTAGATGGTSGGATTGTTATTGSTATGVLPHTGFDGRYLAGGAVAAGLLGGAGLFATRRRRGGHA